MYQPVAGGNDETPRYLRMCSADNIRHMGGSFADQFQVAQRRVVVETARNEAIPIKSIGIRDDLLSERDHVVDVKRHSRAAASDMDSLLLDEGAQFGAKRPIGDQIDRAAQEILKEELDAEVAL